MSSLSLPQVVVLKHSPPPMSGSTDTQLTALISGLGVGDLLFGATMTNVAIQGEAGMFLTNITVLDAASGTVMTQTGSVRLPTAGGKSAMTNGFST